MAVNIFGCNSLTPLGFKGL